MQRKQISLPEDFTEHYMSNDQKIAFIVKALNIYNLDFKTAQSAMNAVINRYMREYHGANAGCIDPFVYGLCKEALPVVKSVFDLYASIRNTNKVELHAQLKEFKSLLETFSYRLNDQDITKYYWKYPNVVQYRIDYENIISSIQKRINELEPKLAQINAIENELNEFERIFEKWKSKQKDKRFYGERYKYYFANTWGSSVNNSLQYLRYELNKAKESDAYNLDLLVKDHITSQSKISLLAREIEIYEEPNQCDANAFDYFRNNQFSDEKTFKYTWTYFYSNLYNNITWFLDTTTLSENKLEKEINLLSEMREAKDTNTILLAVYHHLKECQFVGKIQEGLLSQLNKLPEEITGIATRAIRRDIFLDKDIILQQLGKKLGITHQFQIGDKSVELTLDGEKKLFKQWSGICTLIVENLSENTVTSKEALVNAKLELENCTRSESYAQLFNWIVGMEKVISQSAVARFVNTFVEQMQSCKNPDKKTVQSLSNYFDQCEQIKSKIAAIKTKLNQLANEFNGWQTSYWLPKTSVTVKEELSKLQEHYSQLKTICLTIDDSTQPPLLIEKLQNRVNEFPIKNTEFKFLRKFAEVHAKSGYAQYPVTVLSTRVGTYFATNQASIGMQAEDRAPEITHDLLQNFFYSEIDKAYKKENNGYIVSEFVDLLNKIENSQSLDNLLMALYEYLTHPPKAFAGIVKKVNNSIASILRDLPINETGFNKKLSFQCSPDEILDQLRQRLENVSHTIKLGDAFVSLNLRDENELFSQWKSFAVKLGEALSSANIPFMNRLFLNNIATLKKDIASATNITDLFNVLVNVDVFCTNSDLKVKCEYALNNIKLGKQPDKKEFPILVQETFKETLSEITKTIADLQREFSSWNGALWDVSNDSFINTMDNNHAAMGLKVHAKIANFEKNQQLFSDKKLTSVTLQDVNAILKLQSDIQIFKASNNDYLKLRAEKEKVDAQKEQDRINEATRIKAAASLKAAEEEQKQQLMANNVEFASDLCMFIAKLKNARFVDKSRLPEYLFYCTNVKNKGLLVRHPLKVKEILQGINNELQVIDQEAQAALKKFMSNIQPLQQAIIEMKKVTLSSELLSMFEKIKEQAVQLSLNADNDCEKMQSLLTELKFIELMNGSLNHADIDSEFKQALKAFLNSLNKLLGSDLADETKMELNEIKSQLVNWIELKVYNGVIVEDLTNRLSILTTTNKNIQTLKKLTVLNDDPIISTHSSTLFGSKTYDEEIEERYQMLQRSMVSNHG